MAHLDLASPSAARVGRLRGNFWSRALAFAYGLVLLIGAEPRQAAAQATQPAVGVKQVVSRGVSQSFQFVGRIQAVNKVELRARVEGFLEQVRFREGQVVTAGELLYQIEKDQFRALVEQAKANLASAKAAVINSQLQYDRHVTLAQRQWSPQAQVDQARADLDINKAKLLQMEAALTQAHINLGYTDIASPIAGRIGRTAYTVGNLVNPASGVLATIVSQDPIYVLFPVSVRDLEVIREARHRESGELSKIEIRIRLSNGAEYPQRGLWDLTDPQVDQQTDTLIIRATIPNPEGRLIDGQFITAEIRERREEPRLVIPQAALQFDQTGYYALVVTGDSKVEQRRIQVGPNRDADVVVTAGLQEGENVIVEGVQKVRPGQAVQASRVAEAANR